MKIFFLEIKEQLEVALSEGYQYEDEDFFKSPSELSEYENWESDTDALIEISKLFFKFSSKEIPEDLVALEYLKFSIDAPDYGFYDEDPLEEESYEVEYWTIKQIFEDL